MESHSPKLSLDLSLPWLGRDHIKEPDKSSDHPQDYISRLQVELRKMEAFKRELPLSILLLTDAIESLKKGVLRDVDFDEIASTRSLQDDDKKIDKKSWMSSAQLWSSDQTLSLQLNSNKPRDVEERQECEYANKRGAFSSFNNVPELSPPKDAVGNNKLVLTGPGLCQVTSEPAGLWKAGVGGGGGRPSSDPVVTDELKLRHESPPDQGPRKQRRCWSPELHRRFVEALDRLGGPQVATPKQIRELMQVNGLTNDEVKSHLQKYRLHLRKRPNSMTSLSRDKLFLTQDSQLEGSGGSSIGILNGVANSKGELNHCGSPEGPFHLAIGSAKCSSLANGCDSMEDDYEEKSDSHNWEGD